MVTLRSWVESKVRENHSALLDSSLQRNKSDQKQETSDQFKSSIYSIT